MDHPLFRPSHIVQRRTGRSSRASRCPAPTRRHRHCGPSFHRRSDRNTCRAGTKARRQQMPVTTRTACRAQQGPAADRARDRARNVGRHDRPATHAREQDERAIVRGVSIPGPHLARNSASLVRPARNASSTGCTSRSNISTDTTTCRRIRPMPSSSANSAKWFPDRRAVPRKTRCPRSGRDDHLVERDVATRRGIVNPNSGSFERHSRRGARTSRRRTCAQYGGDMQTVPDPGRARPSRLPPH